MIRVTTLNDVASLYNELQDSQNRAEYFKTRIQPLAEQTDNALRSAFADRNVSAYELTKLMETLGRMKLNDLELRHLHYRLRTRLELLLECRISELGAEEIPLQAPEPIAIPVPADMP
jgi:hypothetical protein